MSYCEVTDLRRFLPREIVFEGENPTPNPRNSNPESLLEVDGEFYIEIAQDTIDGKLAAMYDVPLRKVNYGGRIVYPPPIRTICAMLAASSLFLERVSGADKMQSETAKEYYRIANQRLDNIANGIIRLTNQNSYIAHRTIKSDLFSRPPSPSADPASDSK